MTNRCAMGRFDLDRLWIHRDALCLSTTEVSRKCPSTTWFRKIRPDHLAAPSSNVYNRSDRWVTPTGVNGAGGSLASDGVRQTRERKCLPARRADLWVQSCPNVECALPQDDLRRVRKSFALVFFCMEVLDVDPEGGRNVGV